VNVTESDCTDSDFSGITHEDPFMTEVSDMSDTENDNGSRHVTDYDDSQNGESESDANSDCESNSPESEPSSEHDSIKKPEPNHEILRLLLLSKIYATGPEQLWITASLDYNEKKGQTEISGGNIDDFSQCWIDSGLPVLYRRQLLLPGWKMA
jgi:hypothetical protein